MNHPCRADNCRRDEGHSGKHSYTSTRMEDVVARWIAFWLAMFALGFLVGFATGGTVPPGWVGGVVGVMVLGGLAFGVLPMVVGSSVPAHRPRSERHKTKLAARNARLETS